MINMSLCYSANISLRIHRKPVVYLEPGLYALDPLKPVVLRRGVSLKGSTVLPTIFTSKEKGITGTIQGILLMYQLLAIRLIML